MRTIRNYYAPLAVCAVIFIVLSLLFQISLTITLQLSVPKEEAAALFRTYHVNADTQYYPVGFWTRIRYVNLPRNDYERHLAVATELEARDKALYGDGYIIQGASPYGKDELQIQANGRATPETFMALIREVKDLDQSEPFLRYPPKIFYTYTSFIPGMYAAYRLRHDPRVKNVESGVTSIPLLYLLDAVLNRK